MNKATSNLDQQTIQNKSYSIGQIVDYAGTTDPLLYYLFPGLRKPDLKKGTWNSILWIYCLFAMLKIALSVIHNHDWTFWWTAWM